MSGFIEIKDENLYQIHVFDDGNQKIEYNYDNIWKIVSTNNKGKVKLQNFVDTSFFVESISFWKIRIINEEDVLYFNYINKKK